MVGFIYCSHKAHLKQSGQEWLDDAEKCLRMSTIPLWDKTLDNWTSINSTPYVPLDSRDPHCPLVSGGGSTPKSWKWPRLSECRTVMNSFNRFTRSFSTATGKAAWKVPFNLQQASTGPQFCSQHTERCASWDPFHIHSHSDSEFLPFLARFWLFWICDEMNSNLLLFDIARVRSSRGWRARHHPILAAMATKGSFLIFDVWLVLLLWLDPLCLTIVFLLFSSVQIQIFSLKHMVFLNFFTDLQGSPMLRPGGSLPTEWPWCWQLSWEFLNHGVSTVSLSTCVTRCDMCHHEVVSLAKKPAEKAKATAVKASLTFASCSIRYMYLEVTYSNVPGSWLFLPKCIVARVFHVA